MRRALFRFVLAGVLVSAGSGAVLAGESTDRYAPHPSSDSSYTEQWSFSFWATDKTYFHVQFLSSNLGIGRRHAVKLEITDVGGKRVSFKSKTSAPTFREGDKAVLRYGEQTATWTSDGSLELDLELDGADLTLHAMEAAPAFTPGNPWVRIGDGTYAIAVNPKLTFTARLTYAGRTMACSGYGTADHSWMTLAPHKLAKRWLKIKVVEPGFVFLLTALALPGTREDFGRAWLWYDNGTNVFTSRQVDVRLEGQTADSEDDSPYRLPARITIRAQEGDRDFSALLVVAGVKHRKDIAKELGPFERLAVRAVAQPMDYSLAVEGQYLLKTPTGTSAPSKTHDIVLQYINP